MDLTNLNKDRKTRRKVTLELGTMMYGKVPPQAKDIEEKLLGKILNDQSIFDQVTELIKAPEFFYVEGNQIIFRAMMDLRERSIYIDILSVQEQLKKVEELDLIGGPYQLVKLSNGTLAFFDVDHYCKIITEKHVLRELIRIGGSIVQEAYDDGVDMFELLDTAEADLFSISFKNMKSDYVRAGGKELINVLQHIEKLRHRQEDITGIPSMFTDLDKITGGWQDTDLILIAARPSVGKTAFALNCARNAAFAGFPVGFFSMEMSKQKLQERLLSAESGLPIEKISRGRLDDSEMEKLTKQGAEPISNMPLFIDDTAGLTIYQLRSKARQMKNRDGVKLIFIDYLQLMSGIQNGRKENREQEISKISRDLKGLAKELKIPIIALSQLSREVEKRTDGKKMPQLSDLRESGALEQDADLVMFMYRPEYYNIHIDEKGKNITGETSIKISKHRNGILGTVKVQAQLWKQKFENITEEQKKEKSLKNEDMPFPLDEPAKLTIQKGSKMSPGEFDEGEEYDFTNQQ